MNVFNAAKAYRKLKSDYVSFLIERTIGPFPAYGETTFWHAAKDYLTKLWMSSEPNKGVFAHPVVEAKFSYPLCGSDIPTLIEDKVLAPQMRSFIPKGKLGPKDQLYVHQHKAIVASKTKNIIVASGTGSGKTECFLYSMINNLLQDPKEDLSKPGVRILMIYPMNALVKDQLRRIVEMVNEKEPAISVGMYTGQTPHTEKDEPRQPWELDSRQARISSRYYKRSRDVIRAVPPHILITNYSMLEYMMLRQDDVPIFETSRGMLRAIVLDEAHLYSGCKGNDINMLIRRTLDRFDASLEDRPEEGVCGVRLYATSATIRNNRADELIEAASALFGAPKDSFEAITGDRDYYTTNKISGWDADADMQKAAIELVNKIVAGEIDKDGKRIGPKGFLEVTEDELDLLGKIPESATSDYGDGKAPVLPYKLHVFNQSPNHCYSDMAIGEACPMLPLGNLQRSAFFEGGLVGLECFTTNRTRKEFYFKARLAHTQLSDEELDNGLQPAYWMFSDIQMVKDSVVVYFRLRVPGLDDGRPGFALTPSQDVVIAEKRVRGWKVVPNDSGRYVYAFKNFAGVTSQNQFGRAQQVALDDDACWGFANGDRLYEFSGVVSASDEAGEGEQFEEQTQSTTYRSGSRLMPIGFVPQSLRSVTMAELLFPHLTDAKMLLEKDSAGNDLIHPWNGRQMLFFSDSRSGAAESAVVLQKSHHDEMIRCYLREGLSKGFFAGNPAKADSPVSFVEICDTIIGLSTMRDQFTLPQMLYVEGRPGPSRTELLRELRAWLIKALVYQEIAVKRVGPRFLEGLGLVHVSIAEGAACPKPDAVLNDIRGPIQERERLWKQEIVPALVNLFRKRRKIVSEFVLSIPDKPKNRKEKAIRRVVLNGFGYIYGDLVNAEKRLMHYNNFSEWEDGRAFLRRYFAFADNDYSAMARKLFDNVLFPCSGRVRCSGRVNLDGSNNLFLMQRSEGTWGYMLNADMLRYSPESVELKVDRLSNAIVERGTIEDCDTVDVPIELQQSFYYSRYAGGHCLANDGGLDFAFDPSPLGGLRVPEHSAQLGPKVLSAVEEDFKKQRINVISCTPTMEVGVDIGGLGAVVQSNLPPEKSSYIQRAGRAGRRDDYSAIVMTLTGKDIIDTEVMNSPMSLFNRSNIFAYADPSKLSAKSQVIAHLNQFLIDEYFRRDAGPDISDHGNPMSAWDCVGNFLADYETMKTYEGVLDRMAKVEEEEWIKKRYEADLHYVQELLKLPPTSFPRCKNVEAVLSPLLADEMFKMRVAQIVADTAVGEKEVPLLLHDLQEKLMHEAEQFTKNQGSLLNEIDHEGALNIKAFLTHQFSNYYRKMLIASLSHASILPSYGFPINIVSLQAGRHCIERSVFSAIGEFTPGSNLTIAHEKFTVNALTGNYASTDRYLYEKHILVQCKVCGVVHEVVTKESFVCSCGTELDPLHQAKCKVTDYVTPQGYRSKQKDEGREAASSLGGRIFAVTDTRLVHGGFTIQKQAWGHPAKAQFRLLRMNDPCHHAIAFCINKGRCGQGFWVDTQNGEIISACKGDRRVAAWCNEHAAHRTANPIMLASTANVSAFLCAIPCTDQRYLSMPSLRNLLSVALQVEATTFLELQSRDIQQTAEARDGIIYVYLYDTSGTSCYMEELLANKETILANALERIKRCRTKQDAGMYLVNYTTQRVVGEMSDADFGLAVEWVARHSKELTDGAFATYSPDVQNAVEYKVSSVGVFDNPLSDAGSKASKVTLLVKEPRADALTDTLAKVIGFNHIKRIDVVFDSMGKRGVPTLVRADMHNRMVTEAQTMKNLGIVLKYYEVDFDSDPVGKLFGHGIRFAVGGKWYLQLPPERARPESESGEESSVKSRSVLELTNNERAVQFFKDWLVVEDVDANAWNPPADSLVKEEDVSAYLKKGDKIVWLKEGQKYAERNFGQLFTELDLDVVHSTVKSIRYKDPYFYTPALWKTMSMVLKAMPRFSEDATVEIDVANFDPAKKRYLFEMPVDGPKKARAGKTSSDDMLEADAKEFADYVSLAVFGQQGRIRVSYTNVDIGHARVMEIGLEKDGVCTTHRIVLDRGFDVLDFKNLNVNLWSGQTDSWLHYSGDFYIMHENL